MTNSSWPPVRTWPVGGFPAGIGDPNDLHNYKFIDYQGILFDLVLLAMFEKVAARWHIRTDRFALHGFSGGGQFAHRFLLLHPDRLHGVSIGAPGRVTLPTSERPGGGAQAICPSGSASLWILRRSAGATSSWSSGRRTRAVRSWRGWSRTALEPIAGSGSGL
jgi:pimeloyl-ACP methyl ester carboxylesterase